MPYSTQTTVSSGSRGTRILLVDDEPMVLEVQAEMLRRAGYDVDAHGDVEPALSALTAGPRRYDLLVTDRAMPSGSGLDLAARARVVQPALPVVLLTGNSELGDAESPHITVVLTKPATGKALEEAIERAIVRSLAARDTAVDDASAPAA
jgi:CheY-like chemotaxis protein